MKLRIELDLDPSEFELANELIATLRYSALSLILFSYVMSRLAISCTISVPLSVLSR